MASEWVFRCIALLCSRKSAFDADKAGLVTLRKAQPRILIKGSAVNRGILIEAKNRSLTPLLTPLPGKSVESSGQFGEVSGMDRIHKFAVDRATVRLSVAGSERRCDASVSKKWKSRKNERAFSSPRERPNCSISTPAYATLD